jgi:predicted small metal-binding protein
LAQLNDEERPGGGARSVSMKEVTCSCGYVASAETAEELLTEVEIHIAASHGAESGRTGEARRVDPEGHTEAAGSAGLERRQDR